MNRNMYQILSKKYIPLLMYIYVSIVTEQY